MNNAPTPRRAIAATTASWGLRISLALLLPGLVSLAAILWIWVSRWSGFYALLFGALFAPPIGGVTALVVFLLVRFVLRPVLARSSRRPAIITALTLGLFGHLALGAYLLWGAPTMPIATLERPNLADKMADVASVARAPATGLVDLARALSYPSAMSGPTALYLVDPRTGVFHEWRVLPTEGRLSIAWSRAAARLFVLSVADGESRPPRLFRAALDGMRDEIPLPAETRAAGRSDPWGRLVTADGHALVDWSVRTEAGAALADGARHDPSEVDVRLFPIDHDGPASTFVLKVHDRSFDNLTWAPDGTWMAYSDTCGDCPWHDFRAQSDERCHVCVFRAGPRGEQPRVLSQGPKPWPAGRVRSINISPDGMRVAFIEGDPWTVWLVDADATHRRALRLPSSADHAAAVSSLAWSPESDRLALLSDAFGEAHGGRDLEHFREQSIYVVGSDGSGLVRLSARPQAWGQLVWLP